MCLDYTSIFGLATPFKAISRRHYAVFLSSTAFVLLSIILPAMSGVIFNVEWGALSFSAGKTEGLKFAVVSVNSGVAIATQVIHGVVCGIAVALAIILFFRRSGVHRDPKGIGNLASLVSDANRADLSTLRLFRQIPSFAHSRVIYDSLRDVKFKLGYYVVFNDDGSSSTTYQLAADALRTHDLRINDQAWNLKRDRTDANGFWLRRKMAWFAEILLWLGQASITTAIYYASRIINPDGDTDKISISRIVLTVCITLGGMIWMSIQRDLQTF
jgi:hypothetical protein